MNPAIDLAGRKFGRLTVIARSGSDDLGKATWACACDCGNPTVVRGYNLRQGDTQSCGCLVGLVRRAQPETLYDGLTLKEHAARSGIPYSTLDKRVRKYGEPFPAHLDKSREEQEHRVFEQDRENNRRSRGTRLGRAAAWHTTGNLTPAPDPIAAMPAQAVGEPGAEFADQDASSAAAHHPAENVAPYGPMHERWGRRPTTTHEPRREGEKLVSTVWCKADGR